MKTRANGAVITVSSGSANHPGPFNSLYSATKAFGIQFSRSMHIENWGTGVDFYVCTPFYIVSNLFKRKEGTILAPMPDALVKGTLAQLGKKYVYEGHGYWFHGLLGNVASIYWGTTDRWRYMMTENRRRADEKESANYAHLNPNSTKEE
jgi:NAD(P)-dependent dehydrogenase (short-subunit alcohol dehydrogenase family)